MSESITETARCSECGMTGMPREYHPLAMCELFKATHDSTMARSLIQGVLRYGMAAERNGIEAEAAMADISKVIRSNND